jgi:hypothetical protein
MPPTMQPMQSSRTKRARMYKRFEVVQVGPIRLYFSHFQLIGFESDKTKIVVCAPVTPSSSNAPDAAPAAKPEVTPVDAQVGQGTPDATPAAKSKRKKAAKEPKAPKPARQLFAVGKDEVGLGHYEVRSWVGWHHHMTLTLLALWFLQLERNRLGGKIPALTVPQLREIFARLLLPNPPSAARIAEEVSIVLRRNEETRIYHWYAKTRSFPPRRRRPDG